VRSHGGAVRRLEATQDYPLRTKETLHRDEKVRIGRAAAELVQTDETTILDTVTTTAEVARHLKRMRMQSLTGITNALNIAVELADTPGIALIVIGGLLRPVSCSFVGPQAEAMMNEFHADRLFLAVDGKCFKDWPFQQNPALDYRQPCDSGIYRGTSQQGYPSHRGVASPSAKRLK
jgi:DeoR family transcriptional regulator of aga operon